MISFAISYLHFVIVPTFILKVILINTVIKSCQPFCILCDKQYANCTLLYANCGYCLHQVWESSNKSFATQVKFHFQSEQSVCDPDDLQKFFQANIANLLTLIDGIVFFSSVSLFLFLFTFLIYWHNWTVSLPSTYASKCYLTSKMYKNFSLHHKDKFDVSCGDPSLNISQVSILQCDGKSFETFHYGQIAICINS